MSVLSIVPRAVRTSSQMTRPMSTLMAQTPRLTKVCL